MVDRVKEQECSREGDSQVEEITFSPRGALEMVHLEVAAWFAQDSLKVSFGLLHAVLPVGLTL